MTNIAILSDIHGNLPALEAALVDLANFDVDYVIVPSDVISFGPFSRQTAELVIDKGWSVIRGNREMKEAGRRPFAACSLTMGRYSQSLKDPATTNRVGQSAETFSS